MQLNDLETGAAERGLAIVGAFHTDARDTGIHGKTMVLLGPDPATFWDVLQASPEAGDEDPVDRYSRRVIGRWACALGGKAYFPFGTTTHPFFSWALRTGRCHASPVQLLVHDAFGLNVSFRGALALRERLDIPNPPAKPCEGCHRACLTACPVSALSTERYDLEACHGHLDTPDNACMTRGCAARRACPASPPRPDALAAHHMGHFHR